MTLSAYAAARIPTPVDMVDIAAKTAEDEAANLITEISARLKTELLPGGELEIIDRRLECAEVFQPVVAALQEVGWRAYRPPLSRSQSRRDLLTVAWPKSLKEKRFERRLSWCMGLVMLAGLIFIGMGLLRG